MIARNRNGLSRRKAVAVFVEGITTNGKLGIFKVLNFSTSRSAFAGLSNPWSTTSPLAFCEFLGKQISSNSLTEDGASTKVEFSTSSEAGGVDNPGGGCAGLEKSFFCAAS